MSAGTSQRMAALEMANVTRLAQVNLRRRLKTHEVGFREALADPAAAGMDVWRLVKALPAWGEHKILGLNAQLCRRGVVIPYGKRVRTLTERQREALVAGVERRDWAPVEGLSAGSRAGACMACGERLKDRSKRFCGWCTDELLGEIKERGL